MERRVLGNWHARCGMGERFEIISGTYLSSLYVSVTKFNNVTKLEESRRVLFTAVTRARDELICTGVANKKGRAYIEEIFGYAGKPWEVIPDEEDVEKRARKERAAEVREIVNKARKENEPFKY